MYYLAQKTASFLETADANLIALHNCLQELQLWKGENPLKAELGIDYWAVFESRVFLEQELTKVLERHEKNFAGITIVDCSQTPEVATATIDFIFADGNSIRADLKQTKDIL